MIYCSFVSEAEPCRRNDRRSVPALCVMVLFQGLRHALQPLDRAPQTPQTVQWLRSAPAAPVSRMAHLAPDWGSTNNSALRLILRHPNGGPVVRFRCRPPEHSG